MNSEMWKPGECRNMAEHLENAIDRAFQDGKIRAWELADRWYEIEQDARIEFENCDGHY